MAECRQKLNTAAMGVLPKLNTVAMGVLLKLNTVAMGVMRNGERCTKRLRYMICRKRVIRAVLMMSVNIEPMIGTTRKGVAA